MLVVENLTHYLLCKEVRWWWHFFSLSKWKEKNEKKVPSNAINWSMFTHAYVKLWLDISLRSVSGWISISSSFSAIYQRMCMELAFPFWFSHHFAIFRLGKFQIWLNVDEECCNMLVSWTNNTIIWQHITIFCLDISHKSGLYQIVTTLPFKPHTHHTPSCEHTYHEYFRVIRKCTYICQTISDSINAWQGEK